MLLWARRLRCLAFAAMFPLSKASVTGANLDRQLGAPRVAEAGAQVYRVCAACLATAGATSGSCELLNTVYIAFLGCGARDVGVGWTVDLNLLTDP
jgi:hypothetical protein